MHFMICRQTSSQEWSRFTKTLLVMKLTVLFLTGFCVFAHAGAYSQKVTLSEKNVRLEKIFTKIKEQTGYTFFYDETLLNDAHRISIKVKDASLKETLNNCFKDQSSLTYVIVGKTIIVKKKRPAETPVVTPVTTDIILKGRVIGEDGVPVSGASIMITWSTGGTKTDSDGNFELTLPENKEVILQVSSIGYKTQTVTVTNRTSITIRLEKEVKVADEVVIVGYGTQKKVNLTGAVSSVDARQIENRAASDISAVLAGQAPGLTIVQGGGNPGRNTGVLNIRGIGSFNNADPLIIVDGIPTGSITDVNPQDIANVSVLKDAASASIYGVRAANGVILITTKRGGRNDKPKTSFSHQTGYTQFIRLPQKANAVELAQLHNQANDNDGTPRLFTDEDIRKFGDGSSPLTHANIDLIDLLFSKGLWNSDNLSVSGGSERGTYNVSLGHIYEGGIINQTGLKKYTLRTNLDYKATSKLNIGINVAGTLNQIKDPGAGINWITHIAFREWANDALQFPDGRWANPAWSGREHNALAYSSDAMGYSKTNDVRLIGTGFAEYQIIPSLSIKGVASVLQDFNKTDGILRGVDLYRIDPATGVIADNPSSATINLQKESPVVNNVSRDYFNNTELNYQLLLNYDKTFGKHSITGLAGFEQRQKRAEFSNLYRRKLLSDQLDQINAATDINNDGAMGNTTEFRLRSVFGRINYSYDSRYLLEGNIRYDGSSRFAPEYRYDYFPSVSLGWRISKEKFFRIASISELKFRASWGKLGNQEVGDYVYLPTYGVSSFYLFGGQQQPAIIESELANQILTWEKTTANNIGLDLGMFDNRFTLSADYFVKNTDDILMRIDQPGILGAVGPVVNAGAVKNTGFEIDAGFKDQAGKVNYYVRANFSKVKNEITNLAGTDRPGFRVGDPLQNNFGYSALGLFQSQQEIDNHASQAALGAAPKPGDIKYADLNKDNKIDAEDRENLGTSFPGITYGFSLGADYKGFDFSMVWQGVADRKIMGAGRFIQPFWLGASPLQYQMDSWTTDNTDAKFPRASFNNASNYTPSSYWLRNGAYLKMRNIQLGYSLNPKISGRLRLIKARLFVSAENLITITSFDYGFDPEDVPSGDDPVSLFGNTANYPTTKRILAGLTLTF
jgi:TonB-linked SusC/RagA family outer membrane protein